MKRLFFLMVIAFFLMISSICWAGDKNPPLLYTLTYYNASWYGPGFHGRLTANGEIYDMHGLTAAHKRLPFNTKLLVINPLNNKSVIVRINDRGPYISGRDLDLSYGAAKAIEAIDVGVLKVKVLKKQ